mgnify:CR=1 FL=1
MHFHLEGHNRTENQYLITYFLFAICHYYRTDLFVNMFHSYCVCLMLMKLGLDFSKWEIIGQTQTHNYFPTDKTDLCYYYLYHSNYCLIKILRLLNAVIKFLHFHFLVSFCLHFALQYTFLYPTKEKTILSHFAIILIIISAFQ